MVIKNFYIGAGNENNQFINSENNYTEYTDNDITWEGSIKLNKTIVKNNAKLIIKPGTQNLANIMIPLYL